MKLLTKDPEFVTMLFDTLSKGNVYIYDFIEDTMIVSNKIKVNILSIAITLAFAITAHAVNIDLITVGNPGNAPYLGNSVGTLGAVAYTYQIGKYEVTNAQYCEFLNAKLPNISDPETGSLLASDIHGLYDPQMETEVYGGINYDPNNMVGEKFSPKPGFGDRPVNYVCPYDAIRFINWLQNGQGDGDTETGVYTMLSGGPNSGTSTIIKTDTRAQWSEDSTSHWVLPSVDEWFKAAYHKNDGVTGNYWLYPTGSDSQPGRDMSEETNPGNNANYQDSPYPIDSETYYTTPVGEFELSQSPYGTFDQAGNVFEWHEWSLKGLQPGGAFDWDGSLMRANVNVWLASEAEQKCVGFRLGRVGGIVVPEPTSFALLIVTAIYLITCTRKKRKA